MNSKKKLIICIISFLIFLALFIFSISMIRKDYMINCSKQKCDYIKFIKNNQYGCNVSIPGTTYQCEYMYYCPSQNTPCYIKQDNVCPQIGICLKLQNNLLIYLIFSIAIIMILIHVVLIVYLANRFYNENKNYFYEQI